MRPPLYILAAVLLAGAACSSSSTEAPAQAPLPVLGAASAIVPIAAEGEAPPVEPAAAAPITLLITADNWGEIAPCGCKNQPAGGLSRRATWIGERRARGQVLVLDAGDALFPEQRPPSARELAQAGVVLAGMKEMGTAALAVGDRDLAAGVDWLVREAAAAGLPLISANLLRADGSRPFAPSQLLSAGEHRVGVIGLWAGAPPKRAGLQMGDAVAAARAEAEALRAKGATLVVALAHGSDAEMKSIAGVPGIDFIIPAHDGSAALPYTAAENGAWIVGAGSRGRQLLQVEVHPDGEGRFQDARAAERRGAEREHVERRLADASVRRDLLQGKQREAFESFIQNQVRRLAELDEAIAAAATIEGRRFSARNISLVEKIAADPALDRRVEEFLAAHPAE